MPRRDANSPERLIENMQIFPERSADDEARIFYPANGEISAPESDSPGWVIGI